MHYLRSIWRRLRPLAMLAACWLAMYGTALAKAADQSKEEPGAGPWVSPYGVVLLSIVLGMLGTCLSSRRRERDKPETYEKSKLVLPGKK
jgi:hypothetical protein